MHDQFSINLAIQTSHHFHMSSSIIFYSNQQHSQVQTADDTDTVTDSASRDTVTAVTDSASPVTVTTVTDSAPAENNVIK